jgi:cell division protein FtsL
MYTFSNKLKTFAIALMVLGILGMAYGFLTVPKDTHEVEQLLQSHDSHSNDHKTEANSQSDNTDENDHKEHVEHVFHQMQNRPWSAFFISAIFFFMVSLLVLVFYAIQWAAEAGWSIVLFRVMEALTAYILPGSIILFLFLLASGFHMNHIYVWMSPEAIHDELIQAKKWWLNIPGWLIRAFIYLAGYNIFRYILVRNSRKLDETKDYKTYINNKNLAVGFLAFYGVTQLFMSFDWLMSLDPHWFSQLYSFYVFASMLVTAITVIAITTIYLKSKEYLPEVNTSHIHDLAKYMFGFSIFWTYFWFDQFMLQWYSNQPEEVVYFVPRLLGAYQVPFIAMLLLNFILPILILISSDFKRHTWIILIAGLFIIIGHFVDVFILISPATVGSSFGFGIPEIGSILFFAGLFIFFTFRDLTKAKLKADGNPFIKESELYHY